MRIVLETPIIDKENIIDWDKLPEAFDIEEDIFVCPLPKDHPMYDHSTNRAVWNPQRSQIEINPC